ncbi:hypothetical protein EUX98_g7706 [Antrodiella citrinella]|uniref:Uncharacterized protein n=1 Tax=Antrodiella citrinella TaxID=2447956 RepID=A0A4S4MKW6_9APHY|nr:hypothetical protein EUX98_g7706 [Antrodiella citrinella]
MISSSATTPALSRSSTFTGSSLSSSCSSSLITPASATGSSFARIQDGSRQIPDTFKIRGTDVGFGVDGGRVEMDAVKGSPSVGSSLATAVRRAKTFAKRTVNVRRVISRTKRRPSVCEEETTDKTGVCSNAGPVHSTITEEPRALGSLSSLSSLREVTQAVNTLSTALQNKASISSLSLLAVHGSPNPSACDNNGRPSLETPLTPLGIYAARAALFIPWCILVGGAIVLSPKHLSRFVAITPGTSPHPSSHAITPTLPSSGPRRFAYWAECAYYHVAIFLGCIGCVLWFCFRMTNGSSAVGTCVFASVLARWMYVWKSGLGLGQVALKKRIQLGENDEESVWLVLTEKYLENGGQGTEDIEIFVGDVCMSMAVFQDMKMSLEGCGDEDGADELE